MLGTEKLRNAVFGHDGLLLITDERGVTLYAVVCGQPQPLGSFKDMCDAWEAIDVLDLAATDALDLAA
jgi:hypothetical protein